MEIRCINASDDRMSISKMYEESWKYAYNGIIPQDYLKLIPEGQWAEVIDSKGRNTRVALEEECIVGVASYGKSRFPDLEENKQARYFYEHRGFVCDNVCLVDNIGGKDLRKVRYVFRA